jgi:hypothetical protein
VFNLHGNHTAFTSKTQHFIFVAEIALLKILTEVPARGSGVRIHHGCADIQVSRLLKKHPTQLASTQYAQPEAGSAELVHHRAQK